MRERVHLLANAPFVVKFEIFIQLYLTDNERIFIEIQNTFLKTKLLLVMGILGICENIVIENVLQ